MGSQKVWWAADGGGCQVSHLLLQAAAVRELQQWGAPKRHPAATNARLQAGVADLLHRGQAPEALPHAPQSWRQLSCGAAARLLDQQPQRHQLVLHCCPGPAGSASASCTTKAAWRARAHMLLPWYRPKASAAETAGQQLTREAHEVAGGGCSRQAAVGELERDG